MRLCLTKDFKERPTIFEIAKHEWLEIMADDGLLTDLDHVQIGVNLYQFKRASSFQSSIIAFMTGLFASKEDIQKMGRVFDHMDKSKDGFITIDEIEQCMQEHQGDLARVLECDPDWKAILSTLDANNDGKLDYHEFL